MVSDFTQPSSHQSTMLNRNSNRTHEDLDTNPSLHFPVISSNFYHRLPKLDLQTFSGDILAWQTFLDSFQTTVHTNPSLTNVQRFSYLKSQLMKHEAEQCIAGLALTSANYEQAILLLKERFGQKQHIINAYMQNLLELPNPSLSPASLRNFYDKMETSIRGLESLGQSQDRFGSLLVPIIFNKLPTEMRKTLTREHGKNSLDIKSLREAIGKEAYVQEAGHFKMSDTFTPTASFHTGATSRFQTYKQKNTGNQNKPRKVKTCIFCQESHSAGERTKVSTHEKRYAGFVLIALEATEFQIIRQNIHVVNATENIILAYVTKIISQITKQTQP
ncbi:hypothetical protein LOTGIDRAFT_157146 [Lottia gigantea]|uniref:Uncharacterized protein n=1 Tax=Lottia gigantea TaxID=225164 RepID=V4B3P7_LOTGI|nr:hypothetical protein LOTGIDRAFT_157146 [Lottia gigantea]ESP02011.1 hypothetical protein LOTGIDRAFT_157146 [Lottia gigantea]